MDPIVSFVIATHNRSDVVRETLGGIRSCGLAPDEYEIIVVDSASTDDTPEVIADEPDVMVIPLRANLGSTSKAYGVDCARGDFVVFLDDDSYPLTGTLPRMLQYFDEQPTLAAAGCRVRLPDGREECCAWPDVPVGCGVGFRRSALVGAGNLDRTFFMQAEEYDLTFRLLRQGWDVRVLPDLWVHHAKTPVARISERTTLLDVRNNLRVLARYLPEHADAIYIQDCIQRYQWLADQNGRSAIVERGIAAAEQVLAYERQRFAAWRLTPPIFERLYGWHRTEQACLQLAGQGIRHLALAGLGKNLYAFLRGAGRAGLLVQSLIAEDYADGRRQYRDIPVRTLAQALEAPCDAILISDSSFVRAAMSEHSLRKAVELPIVNLTPSPENCPMITQTAIRVGKLYPTGAAVTNS
jgi:GT2 family glycosyltransferase